MYQITWLFTIQLGKPQHLLLVGLVVKDVKRKVLAHTSSNGDVVYCEPKQKIWSRNCFPKNPVQTHDFCISPQELFRHQGSQENIKKANQGSEGQIKGGKTVSATRFFVSIHSVLQKKQQKTFATNKLKQRNVKINFLVF